MIIPLGMRCSGAIAIRQILNIDQPSFVFDWSQMSIKTMIDIINLEKSDVNGFFDSYFSAGFNSEKNHNLNGDWLPHDFTDGGYSIDEIKERHIRRTLRFLNELEKPNSKKFLTFFGPYLSWEIEENSEKIKIINLLKETVTKRSNRDSDLKFLSVNAWDTNTENNEIDNFYTKIVNWDDSEKEVAEWLKKYT
jgi:hypothetical protein